MKLGLIVIKTRQLMALKTQYELLGLKFDYQQHGRGDFHYSTQFGDTTFEIYPLPTSVLKADDTTRLGFVLPHLETKVAELVKTDWKVIAHPKETDFGFRAIVKDLDGRRVELVEEED